MSHVQAEEMTFNSRRDMESAAALLDAEIVEKSTYEWYGLWMNDFDDEDAAYRKGVSVEDYGTCDLVLRPKERKQDDYEVGLVKQGDGSYRPVYDVFGSGKKLITQFGPKLSKFKQTYATVATKRTLKRQGYRVATTWVGDDLRITATK